MKFTKSGFICIPRSLLEDPLWKKLSLKHRFLFITIIEYAVFSDHLFDDHGKLIELKPGQICVSIRALQDLCGDEFSKNDIERGIAKLKLVGFLRQEVRHTKSVITITHKDTYTTLYSRTESRNETKLRQDRDTKEQRQQREQDNIRIAQSPAVPRNDLRFDFDQKQFLGITDQDLTSWKEAYPDANISQSLAQMSQWILANPSKSKKTLWRKFITNWLARSHNENYSKKAYQTSKSNIVPFFTNLELARKFRESYESKDYEIYLTEKTIIFQSLLTAGSKSIYFNESDFEAKITQEIKARNFFEKKMQHNV